MDLTTSLLIGAVLPLLTGCATGHAASECPEVRQPVAVIPAPSAAPAASTSVASAGAPAAPASAEAPPPLASVAAADSATAPSSASTGAPLPELKVHLSGMHIGGGPNDEASKRPFIHAIESSYDALRACYRKAEDPLQGGTFGVDLKVGAKGGTPEIQQVRTALKGETLRECLSSAFKRIQFGPPPKGPTVVSVSVRFTLGS
jgi:pyruvate/2-oxoglutarate dehydrogenase complex dihydrolipoamide acyltransferase (E2) component